MTDALKTTRLNTLFDAWTAQYPKSQQDAFHADGIIDEEMFKREERRLLFVTLEPNSVASPS